MVAAGGQQRASARPARRLRPLRVAAVCAVLVSALVTVPTIGPASAATGSLLLDETFTGPSAPDSNIVPLGDACLTAATTAPPPGQSTLGVCSSRMGSPPATATPGYLQLNDARNDRTGAMLYNRALPANGGIQITFEQYQFGGTGADGIGFFLVDGAANLTATGASGGSLGYAQKTGIPGVHAGYLGVGLDSFGNFSNDLEGRGTGCPTPSPNSGLVPNAVGLRGPGEGETGYCWLTGVALPANQMLRSATATGANTASAKRIVRITVTPGATPTVTVEIDFGAGFQTILSHTLPTPLPPTFKFGLSASTGGQTDVHLVRNIVVTSLEPLPEINLVKQVAITTPPQPPAYTVSSAVPYQFVVTNTESDVLHDVTVTDPDVSNLVCPSTTLGPAGTPTSTMVCTGTHVITATDATRPTFNNTATATGVNSLGTTVSAESSATVHIASTPVLNKTAVDPLVIAGNPVGFKITLENPGPPSALSDLTLTDPLPAASGVDWTIATQYGPATCSITGAPPTQTLSCGSFTLDVGQIQFVQVTSQTLPTTPCVTLGNTATAASPVVGTHTASDQVIVDCRGSLTVTKTINGPAAGQQGQVTIGVNCGGTNLPDFVIAAGETGPQSKTYPDLTAGQACTVTEIQDGTSSTVTVTITGDDQTVTIAPGKDETLNLTDDYEPAPGSLTVTKLIAGDAASQQGPVTLHVACTIDETVTFSGDFVLPENTAAGPHSHMFEGIPANSTCTVTETANGATPAVKVTTEGSPQTVTIPAGGAITAGEITDTYTFVPGSLTVTKTIDGPAAGQQGQITIQTECDGVLLSPDLVIRAGTTASPQSLTYPDIPAGQECTVTETENGETATVMVDTTGDGQTVTVPAGANVTVALTDTFEPRPPGSLEVTKVITGPAAGNQGPVVIRTMCNGVALTPVLLVPAKSPRGDYSHTYAVGPPTSTCIVTEIANGATAAVTVATRGSPQTVTVPSGGSAAARVIDIYRFAPGSLIVSKTIAGPAAGRQGAVTIRVVCGGTTLAPFAIPAGTVGTVSHTYSPIRGNAKCTATEDVDGSTPNVTVTITGDNGKPVTVPPGGTAARNITNTYDPVPGTLVVRKLIAGPATGQQGPVTIHVACTIGGTPTFTGDFLIPAGTAAPGGSETFDIPSGSTCRVTETADGSNSTVTVSVVSSPQIVDIAPQETAFAELADIYDFKPGSLTVSKSIFGPAAGQQGKVSIHTECNGLPLAPDLEIPAGTPASTLSQTYPDLPGTATCLVSEQLDGTTETVQVSVTGSPQSPTVPPAGTTVAILTDAFDPRPAAAPPAPGTGPEAEGAAPAPLPPVPAPLPGELAVTGPSPSPLSLVELSLALTATGLLLAAIAGRSRRLRHRPGRPG